MTVREILELFHPGVSLEKLLEPTEDRDFDAILEHHFGIDLDTQLIPVVSNAEIIQRMSERV